VEGTAALEVAMWGASRLRLPVAVAAADPDRAEFVARSLREAGIQVAVEEGGEGEAVRLRWAPAAAPAP
jgi:hypothetical protein